MGQILYNKMFMPNLWIIFTTGLLTGGLTCMAVQGGLLAATIAQQEEENPSRGRARSIVAFLLAKLMAYTALGALLGYLGSFFQLSPVLQGGLMVAVAVFMVGTALSMLDVHPVFRFFVLQPPHFIRRMVRLQTKRADWFAPAILGWFTVFIPCGTTQAMMALAVATGNPMWGALVLGVFVLGTSPMFFLLGYSIDKLKELFAAKFSLVTAAVVIAVAVWNFNSGLTLMGSPFAPTRLVKSAFCAITFCPASARTNPTNAVTITFNSRGYRVDNPVIKGGERITLNLVNASGEGCIQSFTVPKYGIQTVVPVGSSQTVEFTAPDSGEVAFSCSMGMYSGTLLVARAI